MMLRIPILIDELSRGHVDALLKGIKVNAKAKNSWVAFVAVTICMKLEYRTRAVRHTIYAFTRVSKKQRFQV